jgi:hypothetical protein
MRDSRKSQGHGKQLKVNGHIPNTRRKSLGMNDILQQQDMRDHLNPSGGRGQ